MPRGAGRILVYTDVEELWHRDPNKHMGQAGSTPSKDREDANAAKYLATVHAARRKNLLFYVLSWYQCLYADPSIGDAFEKASKRQAI